MRPITWCPGPGDVQRQPYKGGLLPDKTHFKDTARSGKGHAQLDKCNQRFLELKRSYGGDEGERRTVPGEHHELLPDVNVLALNLMTMFGELETFMNENIEFPDRDLCWSSTLQSGIFCMCMTGWMRATGYMTRSRGRQFYGKATVH